MKAKIIIDVREIYSGIPDLLSLKADVEIKQLAVGDYILSDKIAVERKRAEDFLESLINKRIFNQIDRLKEAYEKPILIIEDVGLFSRNINERAIYGAIAYILTECDVPVIRTRDAEETASLLYAIAVREQFKKKKDVSLRGKKPKMSLKERQQFIIEGLPNVSAVLAKRLLDYFGSVKNVINASLAELKRVEGIGEKKAKAIKEVIEAKWNG